MQLSITNSLSNRLEVFTPLDNKNIKMYVCGPTVYDYSHIGNARSVVVYDALYRVLQGLYGSDNVTYVRNITDVDDKINIRAKELNISILELTTKTTIDFHQDIEYLNCLAPTYEPKATEHIYSIIKIVERLLSNGAAYISNNHIYFAVQNFADYGLLAGRKIEELVAGSRIEVDAHKRYAGDFVLWKPASASDDDSAIFDSPWGKGRPGWHIECSAMSHFHLGENFDIHGGGADLMFPHHTNEIAQSCSAFPGSNYAKYWVHNGFLTVQGEKMSKSLSNFITVNELRNQGVNGEIIRYCLLKTHYRSPLDFNDKARSDASIFMDYCYRALEESQVEVHQFEFNELEENLLQAILQDLNTHLYFAIMHELAKSIFKSESSENKKELGAKLYKAGKFLGFFNYAVYEWFNGKRTEEEVKVLIESRRAAKLNKDWNLADMVRKQLLDRNIILEDKPDGSTVWRYKKS